MDNLHTVLEILKTDYSVLFAVGLIIIAFILGKIIGSLSTKAKYQNQISNERKDAVKRSRAIIDGQLIEQMAPYLPNFPAKPTEVAFLGQPIDYIAFNGSTNDNISEVLFIEIKSGKSQLSPVEKSLKKAIETGKVKYLEYRFEK